MRSIWTLRTAQVRRLICSCSRAARGRGRRLYELCPDAQFIVATHSEEILDSALSYERFILVESDDPRL
jgi:hypothetical protein